MIVALLVALAAGASPQPAAKKPVSLEMPPPPPGARPVKRADPAPAPAKPTATRKLKLASPNLSGLNVSDKEAQYFTDHLAAKLGLAGFDVITASQVAAMIGFERQKELLGCGGGTSCIAELANALGADALLTGSIGKFGNKYQINLKILGAADGRPLAVYSGEAFGDAELLALLTESAGRLADEVRKKVGGALGPSLLQVSRGPTLHDQAWIPAAAGVAAGAAGGFFLFMAKGQYDSLVTANPATTTPAQAQALRDSGKLNQWLGIGGTALGAAGLVTAGVFFFMPQRSSAIALLPTDGGGIFALSGSLP